LTPRTDRNNNRAALPGRPDLPRPRRKSSHFPTGHAWAIGAAGLLLGHAATAGELADCRPITDDQQRLACYDSLAPTPAAAGTTPEALFGLEAQQSAALLQQRLGDTPMESLQQVVSTISTNRNGKLRLRLDNGQVWEQTDSDRLALKPGDAVTIRRAALGSFLLSRTSGGRSIRVRRGDAAAP
jgi:hypothetical protein